MTINLRLRVPAILQEPLNRTEIKKTNLSPLQAEQIKTLIKVGASTYKSTGLLIPELEPYKIQPKSIVPDSLYLSDIIELYLSDSNKSVTSGEQRKRVLFMSMVPSMFDKLNIPLDVDKITGRHMYLLSQHMSKLKGSATKKPRKPQTVNREIKMLRGMSSFGDRTGLYSLPLTPTLKLSSKPVERLPLPNDTLTIMEDKLSHRAFILLSLIMHSGMRNSEVSKCTTKIIDDVKCFSLSETNNIKLKTRSSSRVIPVHHRLTCYIEYISTFKLSSIQTLAREINKGLQAHLEPLNNTYTLYSARHYFITELINRKVPPHVVGELAGHQINNSQTLNTYFHGSPVKVLQNAVDVL